MYTLVQLLTKRGVLVDVILFGQQAAVFQEHLVTVTTGQNAVQQAKIFSEVASISGIILTKMDGTAKGGVAFRLVAESGIPIRYIGIGESEDDLVEFDAREFVDAILPIAN